MARRSSWNSRRDPLTFLTPSSCEGTSTAPIMMASFAKRHTKLIKMVAALLRGPCSTTLKLVINISYADRKAEY